MLKKVDKIKIYVPFPLNKAEHKITGVKPQICLKCKPVSLLLTWGGYNNKFRQQYSASQHWFLQTAKKKLIESREFAHAWKSL